MRGRNRDVVGINVDAGQKGGVRSNDCRERR
jgi:hypothetical protein